jgi:cell filamentation protein
MNDPFVDKNGVLKNKLGIKSALDLEKAEADIGLVKLISIDEVESETMDAETLKRIHTHIFGDIYEWAGTFRKVPLFKYEYVIPGLSVPYSSPENLKRDIVKRIEELDTVDWETLSDEEKAFTFARKIALIWRVHPFREGNTRTTLSFAYLYAKKHGFPLDMQIFIQGLNRTFEGSQLKTYSIRDFLVIACLDEQDYPEVEALAQIFLKAMLSYREKHEDNSFGSK